MAVTKIVQAWREDTAKPGLRRPVTQDVTQLTTGDVSLPLVSIAAGVTRTETGVGPFHQTVLTFAGVVVNVTDNTTNGAQASLNVYDFPAGLIYMLGGTANIALVAGTGGVTDTAAIVAAVGTAAAGVDATLTGSEADYIPSTASALTGGAGTFAGKSTITQATVNDGTSSAKKAYLNFAMPDASCTANDTLTLTGTLTLTWVQLGDV